MEVYWALQNIIMYTVDSCVEQFKKKIMEGPYYICCVCNRTQYKKSVLKY